MAGAHGAAIAAAAIHPSSVPPTTTAAPIPRKSLVTLSSLPSSFPSRRRRTNHLRQKILKTLENKPYPDISHPNFPLKTPEIVTKETVPQQTTDAEQFSLSQTTGFVDGIAGEFSTRSFVKIGLYLVGAFIFQTICAVLIFGSNELKDEDGNLNNDDYKKAKVLDSKGNMNLTETKEGGILLFHESEMENRIVEIQEMARGARQQERLEAKRKGLVEEEEDDVDFDLVDKTLKEKEVDSRLVKLRKSLEGNYEKLPPKFPIKEGDKDISAPLMFKKKYKYKSPSIDSGDKPKGFDPTEDRQVVNGELVNEITADDATQQNNKTNDDGVFSNDVGCDNGFDILDSNEQEQIDESMPVSNPITKLINGSERAKQRPTKTELIAGTLKETRKPRGFGQESQTDAAISSKHNDSNRNGSLKGKRGRNRKSGRNFGDMKSSSQTDDFWWTNLPYVLAVLMQRGGKNEESEGLFTLRSNSQSKNGLSHTVAFEDRGDATNFCYLLESFFQDLGDFSTNIIPIPTNELEEAVKSKIIKVVVVKKGQVELYVGQPLEEVESALRTLIQQSHNL